MEKRELICIGCPMGCRMTVELDGSEVKSVSGYTCPRGKTYAENEVTHPMRTVTSTVKVTGGSKERVSCKTASDVPKSKIADVMADINAACVSAPVHIGDILIENVAGTGTAVVATANMTQ